MKNESVLYKFVFFFVIMILCIKASLYKHKEVSRSQFKFVFVELQ